MIYLILLLVTPVLAFPDYKQKLYDTIDCNVISKLNNINIVSNDYLFVINMEQYMFIDKTRYNMNFYANSNNSYCYDKQEFVLYYDCNKHIKFSFHSTSYAIDNFIYNINIIINYNITNKTLRINNNNTKCINNIKPQEFYGLYVLLFLWFLISKCY
jgi:hypothetical protein